METKNANPVFAVLVALTQWWKTLPLYELLKETMMNRGGALFGVNPLTLNGGRGRPMVDILLFLLAILLILGDGDLEGLAGVLEGRLRAGLESGDVDGSALLVVGAALDFGSMVLRMSFSVVVRVNSRGMMIWVCMWDSLV